MENCKLPNDLLIEILARLSVKSLMRFKCVCKFFYGLIKNNLHFMDKHYEISRAKNDCVVIEFGSDSFPRPNKVFNLLYKDSESDEIGCTYLDMPNSFTRYVSCCHGMFCLIVGRGDFVIDEIDAVDMIFDVLVWNPSTREIKALPSITVPDTPAVRFCTYEGFGFGVSNDMTWKVVVLWYFQDINIQSEDSHEIVMVCSQVGDSWSWRQIDAVPHVPVCSDQNFYFKGKYYWRVSVCTWSMSEPHTQERLLWFDMGDEVFGTIKLPSKWETILVTVMNETIALISYPHPKNENRIEIWLMNENNNDNIDWNKQASIECGASIHSHEYWKPSSWDDEYHAEYWFPIGIWNLGGHLLVFPRVNGYFYEEDEGYIPHLVFIDLITHKKKIIYITQEMKSVNIVSNPAGYAQVYHERNINITQEWKKIVKIVPGCGYVRAYSESLKLL